MTKYKLNNDVRTPSEVTLTSYMTGSDRPEPGNTEDRRYSVPDLPQDKNFNSEANRNLETFRSCRCQFVQDKLGGDFTRNDCRDSKFGVSELNIHGLDKGVCLCEKYKNGCCKLCPRSSCAVIDLKLDSSCGSCNGTCHGSYSKNGSFPASTLQSKLPLSHKESAGRQVARRARALCSTKTLLKRLPIIAWLPHYSLKAGLSDMIAGLTVGLTVIPQAIAYANVAGLPPQYGLYSSFMACFVYTIFGSCKDSPIGPTAIAAILTRENLHGLGPEFAVLLCFLSGCVELLMGILQLGFLIDFISGPVSVGFTSAAAIIIATTQVKDILGLSFPGGKFLQVWTGLYEHIGETRLWDSVLGLSCIVVLLLLRKVKDIKITNKEATVDEGGSRLRNWLSNVFWFLSTTRNILVVVLCAVLAYYFGTHNQTPFVLTGEVKPGLPNISLPPFQSTVGNHTYTFVEMASTLGSAIFVVPLLSILENIALAKVFSEGQYVDATQEMIAIGLCNMASSLVDSMPVSGALSRGAVNHASGVQTTFGGVYTGALVLLSLQYFTPYFFYIPKASLAAVIIAAVVFMMELHVFKPIWRTKKLDIIPAIVTFMSCLLIRLELGIVIGIATNLMFLLYASARPSVRVSWATSASGVEHLVGAVDRSLTFPSAEYVRRALRKAADKGTDIFQQQSASPPPPLVIDATHVQAADFTAAKGIKQLIDDFYARGQTLIFYNVKPSIVEIFRGVRPREFLHCACPTELDAMLRAAAARQKAAATSSAATPGTPQHA